jgi:hypothetical protein
MANFVLVPGYWLGGWAWKMLLTFYAKKGIRFTPLL